MERDPGVEVANHVAGILLHSARLRKVQCVQLAKFFV